MIAKNMTTIDDIAYGIITKTANQIIIKIQKKDETITNVEGENIKLRLLHYSKKRGIELI